jgi:hypothetical protein
MTLLTLLAILLLSCSKPVEVWLFLEKLPREYWKHLNIRLRVACGWAQGWIELREMATPGRLMAAKEVPCSGRKDNRRSFDSVCRNKTRQTPLRMTISL